MSNKNLTYGLVIVAVIAIIGIFTPAGKTASQTIANLGGTTNYDTLVLGIPPVGDASATVGALSAQSTLYAGQGLFEGGVNSTSTPASMTLKTSDFNTVSLLSINPSVASITVTFPATTTDTTFLPNAGDCTWDVFHNSTTTGAVNITLAGGTTASGGFILQTSSSTTTVAPKILTPGATGSVRMCRKVNTDISVIFTPNI